MIFLFVWMKNQGCVTVRRYNEPFYHFYDLIKIRGKNYMNRYIWHGSEDETRNNSEIKLSQTVVVC